MKRGGRKINRLIATLWRWSWLVTLPVAIFFCLWAFNTVNAYYRFSIIREPLMPNKLSRIGVEQAKDLFASLNRFFIPGWKYDEEGLDRLYLYVSEANLKSLNGDLPHSAREYVKAVLLYPDGELYKTKMRYRGDTYAHWSGRKKSIRVKTKKSELYEGVRTFNLITYRTDYKPLYHLSYLLAKRMGLYAPESKLTEVYINGKYSGVYLFVEQLGEQFLRRNSLMPGDLYVGELLGRDRYFGVKNNVFLNSALWSKAAINNHNPPEWNEPLTRLTRSIYNEEMDELLDLLDLDSWGRFAAYITLCQTLHFDRAHNWRLYFDPAMGRFIPVIWDPGGWEDHFINSMSKQTNRMDIISNIIFERLHRDQRFLAAKHAAMENFFTSGGDLYLRDIQEETKRLEASLRLEGNIDFKKMLRSIELKKKVVVEVLADIKKIYTETPPSAAYSVDGATENIQINLDGFTPIKFLEIDYASSSALSTDGLSVNIFFEADGKILSKMVTSAVSLTDNTLRIEVPLFAAREMRQSVGDVPLVLNDAVIRPASYRVSVKGAGNFSVKGVRAGYGIDKSIELERKETLLTYSLDHNFHILDTIDKPVKSIVWSGERVIKGVVEIDDNLKISAGSRVLFTPGASLIVSGRLSVEGTKEQPVTFGPVTETQKPWGAAVLTGAGANGSSISHAKFSKGSGLRHDFVEYSAMLSIHGVRGVEISKSTFSDNTVVDDMVHAVYSEVVIRDSVFRGAASDALDLDYVEGTIEGTSFFNSGNDALDLMSSKVSVLSSRMEGSGDKGVSVGEATEVLIWNSTISGNAIGLQVKDSSNAVLYNTELYGNTRTVDAYKKNWQYGDGGHVRLFKSSIIGVAPTLTSDKDSTIEVYDSYFSGEAGKKRKRIALDHTVDSEANYEKRARTTDSFIDKSGLSKGFAQSLKLIDPTSRGRVDTGP